MRRPTVVLRRRLVLSLVAAGLLPFAGAAWIAHSVSVDDARKAARDRIDVVTQGAAGAIDGAVAHAREQATALASDRRVQTALVLNDTYTLGAMSAAGARIVAGPRKPMETPSVQVVVRADGKPIGFVAVALPDADVLLQRAQMVAGSEASLKIVHGEDVLAESGPAPSSGSGRTVRERALPGLGQDVRLVVTDTAIAPKATDVGTRLTIAAAISIAAIALLSFSLARPLLSGLQVVEEAAAEADIDPLTGLANRRSFGRTLEHELLRSARTGRPCALVLVDLDDFKRLNDVHGHAVGDDALRMVSDVLQAQIRTIDLAARLGGEELAVLLPETSTEQAAVVAERLRAALEHAELGGADGSLVPVTGSLGVADSTFAAEPEGLLKAADEALYEAKRAGKNRVVCASRAAANAA